MLSSSGIVSQDTNNDNRSGSQPFAHISSQDWVTVNKDFLNQIKNFFMADKNQDLNASSYDDQNTTFYQDAGDSSFYQESAFTNSAVLNSNEKEFFQGVEPGRVYTGEYKAPSSFEKSSAIITIQVLFIYIIGGILFDLVPKILRQYLFPKISF